MKNELISAWVGLRQLLRFLTWYGLAIAALFLLMPLAGNFLDSYYEAFSATTRLVAAAGFLAVIVSWQVGQQWRRARQGHDSVRGGQAVEAVDP